MKRQNLFIGWWGRGAVVLGLVAIGMGICLASAGASVAASPAPKPDLVVSALANPVPKGEPGTYGFVLAATIANRGRAAARASKMRFYLSLDRRLSSHDRRLPLLRVHGLRPGGKETVHKSWKVPHSLRAGIYYVLACADVKHAVGEHNHCRAAKRTVAVTQPGGAPTKDAGGALLGAGQEPISPKEEFHPQADGAPFQCPVSFHGQDGKCVWVSTPTYRNNNVNVDAFSYCPRPYGWPFEVALGFDPMWEDLGTNSVGIVHNVARQKWTLYTTVFGRDYYPSYGAPNEFDGYVSILLRATFVMKDWVHQIRYLCADRHADSMLP